MIRIVLLSIGICTLAACEQYREPRANCFNFVSRGSASQGCDFERLGEAPDVMDEVHE